MSRFANSRTGYRDRSASNGARFVRPAGEPSWSAGSALVLAIFAIAGMLVIAFTGG